MIDRSHALPLTRQAEVLKLSGSSVYYQPRPVSSADLAIMRRLDELIINAPAASPSPDALPRFAEKRLIVHSSARSHLAIACKNDALSAASGGYSGTNKVPHHD